MRAAGCDLCRSPDAVPYQDVQDRYTAEKFHLVRCAACGLVYLRPRPTDLAPYYPEVYEPHNEAASYHQQRALEMQVDYLEEHVPGKGRLLDVGCATGNFLLAAQSRGWQVSGLELVQRAAQQARSRGLEVFTGTLEELVAPPTSLEAATLWDVLEHLPSPTAALDKLRALLKPGGVLVGSIPNLDSFDRRIFGSSWIGWDTPRHLALFDQHTLPRLLDACGFELLDTRCFLGGRGAFQLSLEILWSGRHPGLAGWLTNLSWPYRQAAYRLKRGPILAFAARRK